MSEQETEMGEKVDELQEKIEQLERRNSDKDQVKVQAYDLRVEVSSENVDAMELLDRSEALMNQLTERALIGEYQELEKQEMFTLLGVGD